MSPGPLIFYPDSRPGISRRRRGRGFSYLAPDGTRIDDAAERARIEAIAVPPAYEKVWICPHPNGHLQATGRDARNRKQYRYHVHWMRARAERKFDHLAAFGEALPAIRRRIQRDLATEPGSREFAIAVTLAMMDRLSLRVGHPLYVAENGAYGATTALGKHLKMTPTGIELHYSGKGGSEVRKSVRHRSLQRALGRLHDLPGAELVTWVGSDGAPHSVRSEMINDTLCDITGKAALTAKTFRTWNGSVTALDAALAADRITIRAMAEAAAEELCNTPAIARNSYIHPRVIELAENEAPLHRKVADHDGLRRSEARLLDLLTA